ncbi:hypothetical protein CYPRO_0092 [Cyclonatronum proteinivorum]|uniref:Fibronectin type-III domain-containing protein n=1 Tax=Cyclonatronum proteinivorum TaxID=1457365 RepID=A0A345UFX8_9BACT|nr:hypothetical protein [Cyclonatronum proteinivorum]AXI99379.1 hypothetical protein CYPRO_0092 [Cyclonatronum proteinivorum]
MSYFKFVFIRMPRQGILAFTLLVVLAAGAAELHAQGVRGNLITDVMFRDGNAFIMHNQPIPLSHGYHVFRSINGGEWEQITDSPVMPVQNGFQLQQQLGANFVRFVGEEDAEDPQSVFLRLRNAGDRAMIGMYTRPQIARLMGHLFEDEDAPAGQLVAYRFQFVDDLEREISLSFETEPVQLEPYRSPAPQNLRVTHENRTVTLSWSYPEAGAHAARHAVLFRPDYRRTDGTAVPGYDGNLRLIQHSVTEYSIRFEVPEIDQRYEFWVKAEDFSGQPSPESNRVQLTVGENVQPAALPRPQVRVTDSFEALLTWQVSTALNVAGYHVYRGLTSEEEEDMVRITDTLLPPLQTSFTDTTTAPGTHYRYAVTVVDQSGNESEFSLSARLLIIDYTFPEPVAAVSAAFNTDSRQVELNWEPGDDYQSLRSYRIVRRQMYPDIGRAFSQLNTGNFTELRLTDSGVRGDGFTEGMTFEYGVAVVNRSGNVSDTVFTSIQIPVLTPPEPPQSVQAGMRENRRVAVRWTSSPSLDVTAYQVLRTDIETGETAAMQTVPRGNRFFRDEDVAFGKTYVYKVAAVDSAGNVSRPAPADTLITGSIQPPLPAFNVMASVTDEGVQLRWQQRQNEAQQTDYFSIRRAEIATGRYEEIGRLEGNATDLRFTDSSGQPGFWYRVYPVDINGRSAREARNTQAVRR